MARRNNRNTWPKVAVVVASAAVLVAGSLPAPAHAARALMQQQPQQPQAPPQAIGDLLGALGLGGNGNGNGNGNNPQNQNSLASVIDRAIATGIPPQQRVRDDDGTTQTQTISARDGNSRSSASATGDVTSVDAGADDGRDDTQEQVTRRGSRNDDRIAGDDDVARQQEPTAAGQVQPATSASRASASSSSAVARGPDDTDYPDEQEQQEIDDPDSPDAPQDFDESDGQQQEEDADEDASFGGAAAAGSNANATAATDAGLQRAAAGVNGTYGALAGLLSNLTGGALQLPPLDTTGNGNVNSNPNNAVRSAPVTELAPGVVASAATKAAASSLVAAAAGAVALVMVMVV